MKLLMIRLLTIIALATALGACARTETVAGAEAPPATAVVAAESAEPVVNPDINKSFQNPNPEQFVQRFETESREIYNHRNEIVAALELKPGMDVADVGAGTGFFTRMFAKEVAPEGKVYAVDIAENFLKHIEATSKVEGLNNVETVLCDQFRTNLPEDSVDLVFICDTYHHFEHPNSTMNSVREALRSDGRLVVIDFERIEGVSEDFVLGHVRGGKGLTTDEIKNAGFEFVREIPMMKGQYIIEFKRRGAN